MADPTQEQVEAVARSLCASDPEIRMGDAEGVVQQRVNAEWRDYIPRAEQAIAALAPWMREGSRWLGC